MMNKKTKEDLEKKLQILKRERNAIIILLIFCICFPIIAIRIHISKDEIAEEEYKEKIEKEEAIIECTKRENQDDRHYIKRYIGDSKKGSEVKLMIEDIISNNNQNVNESGKFISVHNGTKDTRENKIETFTAGEKYNDETLDNACISANVYEDHENGDNNQKNIDEATENMREFAKKISSGRNYKVEACEEDGIIYAVYVSAVN